MKTVYLKKGRRGAFLKLENAFVTWSYGSSWCHSSADLTTSLYTFRKLIMLARYAFVEHAIINLLVSYSFKKTSILLCKTLVSYILYICIYLFDCIPVSYITLYHPKRCMTACRANRQ